MGGRRFRLSAHRKNEERKKKEEPAPSPLVVTISRQLVTNPAMSISIPLAAYIDGHVQSSDYLGARLSSSLSLPSSWIIASRTPLTLCKLRVHLEGQPSRADITFTLSISSTLEWDLSFLSLKLSSAVCPLLAEVTHTLTSVANDSEGVFMTIRTFRNS